MSDGLTIEVSNQDYEIDVILGGTILAEGGGADGFVTYTGMPVADQLAIFSSPSNIVGSSLLTFDGNYLSTPNVKFDHIAERQTAHGIVFEHTANSNELKNVGTYSSGFAGQGHMLKYEGGLSSLTIDNLTVRRKLSAYELEIREVSHVGGSLLLSVANGTVVSYTGTGPYNLYFDIDGGANPVMFQTGDHVRAQIFSGRGIDYFDGSVTYVGSDYITVTSILEPWNGMKLIQDGNPTDADRQNMIYITASDDNNPYIDMLAGVTDGVFAGHQKCRIGNLSGINDPDFGGDLSGYGLYADNVYLKGSIQITAGAGWSNLTDKPDSLGDINSTEGTKLGGIEAGADVTSGHTAAGISGQGALATMSTLAWSYLTSIPTPLTTPAGSGLFLSADHMGYYSASAWKVYIDNNGNLILGDIAGGNSGISWNQGTGVLNIKGVINITSGSVPNSTVDGLGDLALLDSADWSTQIGGTGKPANNATVGATWGTDLTNIPTPLTTPSGNGLFLSSTYMGYYTGGQWVSYIDNAGNCKFIGAIELGTSPWGGVGLEMDIAIKGNHIWENHFNDSGSYVGINKYGFNGGNTYYRNFRVYDGKESVCLEVNGETKTVWFYGPLDVSGNINLRSSLDVDLGAVFHDNLMVEKQVAIGPYGPNSYACLDLEYGKRQSGAPGALIVPCLTQTEINNLTTRAGMVVYNTTNSHFYGYTSSWRQLDS